MTTNRPDETEYDPYYDKYIALVPAGDVVAVLGSQIEETLALLRSIPEERGSFRYAPGKWSVKELLGHLIDSERIFSYRALRFARDDQTALPGYEQDDYVRNGSFDAVPLNELAQEFASVRQATVLLFKHLDAEAWTRRGLANESPASVRALAYMIAGHELHHRRILRDKYLENVT
ncbi:MAG TPA: DinB family protein [Pyrinomonadaceae bacterium]|nr:DinB family protein [Pyrinomonadaceae bacterium]